MKPGSIASLLGGQAIEAPISGPGVTVHRLQGDDDDLAGAKSNATRPTMTPPAPPPTEKESDMQFGHNAQNVLEAIKVAHPAMISRAEIVKATGLDKSQIATAIYQLKGSGAIKTIGATANIRYGLGNNEAADANLAQKTKRAKPARRTKTVKAGKDGAVARLPYHRPDGTPIDVPPATTERRFGFYSDGVLEIDCPNCKGSLTQADIIAMRDFVNKFEPRA